MYQSIVTIEILIILGLVRMSEESSLSLGNLMLNSAKLLAVDLPASWMMDKLAPPPPDLRKLDIETKLRILRGQEPEWSEAPNLNEQWWSPTAWIDKTEQWMQGWIDTSK